MAVCMIISCKPEPEKEPETPTEETDSVLSKMTLEEKVGQLFIVRAEQLNGGKTVVEWTPEMSTTLQSIPVGGICFFSNNIVTKAQLMNLLMAFKQHSTYLPFCAVDEEGGLVARVARSGIMEVETFENMYSIGQTGDPGQAKHAGTVIGSYLAQLGFNLDFAPVADVFSNPQNTVIGKRSFSSDPQVVANMVEAFLSGLHMKKILGTMKHFPGHGDTQNDSHTGYVEVTKTWEEMLACEIIPFKANLDKTDLIMTAHITTVNATSDSLPATMSHEMLTGKLRNELGYQGLIITDALEMGAIAKHYSSAECAVKAIEAGVDILLIPANLPEAYNGVLEAVRSGQLPESRIDESVRRILRAKGL